MKVSFKLKRFATLLPVTCLALATSVTACGDDDGGTDEPVGGAGGTAGKGGSSGGGTAGSPDEGGSDGGGTAGTGGTSGGGTGGTSGGGTGGTGVGAAPSEGGAGGEGAAPSEGGAGGAGPDTFHTAKVNGADGTLVPQVNDLRGVTFASNGKIWAAGYVGQNIGLGGVDRQLAVVRFNADGTLDKSFDGDGIRTVNLRARVGVDENLTNDGDEYAMGIVELANGNVVILANRRDLSGKGRDAVLLKMTPTGTFSNWTAAIGPVRTVDFGWTETESAAFPGAPGAQPTDEGGGLAYSPARKIGDKEYPESVVVFGHGPAKLGAKTEADVQRTDNDRYVLRIQASDGALDPTFNAGKAYTFNSVGVRGDNSRRGNVEALDGSIISAGYTNLETGGNHIVVARLSIDGVPDATFTGGTPSVPGVFVANPFLVGQGVAECYQAARQSTGRYVSTGYGRVTGTMFPAATPVPFDWERTDGVDAVQFGFVQSATGGKLDTTFGREGTLAIQSEGLNLGGTEERGRDLTVLADDRFVIAGRFGVSPALFVVTADGELDPTEGGLKAGPGGTDTVAGAYLYAPLSGTTSHFYAIAKSADGKRVAATTNGHEEGALLAVLNVE
ncbi:MAG: hypothetical protein K0R38_7008 [Polyangiaceae bacterium]|nr:hypothetical protein [Polyangiaceae bacterium]